MFQNALFFINKLNKVEEKNKEKITNELTKELIKQEFKYLTIQVLHKKSPLRIGLFALVG